MLSPAIRLNVPQNNENAESTNIARKPGQSQSLLRKAFQDCPNTPNVNITNNKRSLASVSKINRVSTLKSIKTETPKVIITDDASTKSPVFPDWAYDMVSNNLIDVEEDTPEYQKIDFNNLFKNVLTPPLTPMDEFIFELPKLPEIDYYELPQIEHFDVDISEVEIPQPNFNDFAF